MGFTCFHILLYIYTCRSAQYHCAWCHEDYSLSAGFWAAWSPECLPRCSEKQNKKEDIEDILEEENKVKDVNLVRNDEGQGHDKNRKQEKDET